jgi:leucine dehydrogenase
MSIESLLQNWAGEEVIVRYDRTTGAWIFIAIHSTRLGPAAGGTRMMTYPDAHAALQDAMNLSEGMTYKWALSEMPFGGGKTVISIPSDMASAERTGLLCRYAGLVNQLGGLFSTGPDVGTSPADMDVMAEVADRYVFARTSTAGGSGLYTAYGVLAAIQTTAEHLFGDAGVADRRVLVQGAGGVGGHLIRLLKAEGAEVAFSEVDTHLIQRYRDDEGLTFVPVDRVFDTTCDIFSPCALGGVLNSETIPRMPARAVVGAANNQLATEEDAARLSQRGILYAPDFVVNCGGAVGVTGIEGLGWPPDEAREKIIRTVRKNLRYVFEAAQESSITSEAAAMQLVQQRLGA